MAEVRLESVRKKFQRVVAVNDVTLTVGDHEFLVLLGPSGCGKTTTLRCVAGLEAVDAGRVFIGGRDVTDLPPGRRNIGMVFQSYALFPHMTVFDNIAFGLRIRHLPRPEIERRVRRTAGLLELTPLLDRYPAQLSGGQRQRVAVARALVVEPQVLCMDEPLSNLDALLRLQMRAEIKRLHKEIQATTLYVTHDQLEALSLGDRIAVMKDGAIVQCDVPQKIYDDPASVFVGGFIGSPPMNFLEGVVDLDGEEPCLRGDGFSIAMGADGRWLLGPYRDRRIIAGIRPESVRVSPRPGDGRPGVPARVAVLESLGAYKLLTVQLGGTTLKVTTSPDFPVGWGEAVYLEFDPGRLRFFEPQSGLALKESAARSHVSSRQAG